MHFLEKLSLQVENFTHHKSPLHDQFIYLF